MCKARWILLICLSGMVFSGCATTPEEELAKETKDSTAQTDNLPAPTDGASPGPSPLAEVSPNPESDTANEQASADDEEADDDQTEAVAEASPVPEASMAPESKPKTDEITAANKPSPQETPQRDPASMRESSRKYKVKEGDTLMKIAFENYGSVFEWRKIYKDNEGKIADFSHLSGGTEIVLNGLPPELNIEKNGNPYLILLGDTLGKISTKVYGEKTFWRDIWKNNPKLIKDPNRIYAGFTLYTLDRPSGPSQSMVP